MAETMIRDLASPDPVHPGPIQPGAVLDVAIRACLGLQRKGRVVVVRCLGADGKPLTLTMTAAAADATAFAITAEVSWDGLDRPLGFRDRPEDWKP